MTTESYIGSNVAASLDLLTPKVAAALGFPLEQKVGLLEDARTGAPPRVTWVERDPGGEHFELAPFALAGMDLQWLEAVDYDVHVWADSAAQLSAIFQAVVAQVDSLFGPPGGSAPIDSDTPARPGYTLGKASTKGPKVDPNVAGSAYAVYPITLKAFAPRRLFGSAPIQSVPVTIDIADANGSEEAIPDLT
jgi:hypothetical protein